MKIERIDPPCWFLGLEHSSFQILLYGENLVDASVETNIPYVSLDVFSETEESYLLLSFKLGKNIKAGIYEILIRKKNETIKIPYELKESCKWKACDATITNEDVVYLLMPDRFARASNIENESIDRKNPNTWHGGNIKGMIQALDYLKSFGITAIWHTPLFENSEYHGYAITNHYKIDSRFGTLEDYQLFVNEAHKRGIKVVMDMVFNHCSIEHPWVKCPPMKNWLNGNEDNHSQTNYKITTIFDPYTSNKDKQETLKGWFTKEMPDINLKNDSVFTYLKQMTMWWIEMTGIDAFRMDTYLYSDKDKMIEWQNDISKFYPGLSVIAETWVPEAAYTSQIQDYVYDRLDKKCSFIVMDFAFQKRLEQTFDRTVVYDKDAQMYHHFVYDFLYKNPSNTLAFLDNHDLERWFSRIKSKAKLKQALALLLTLPRIPQIYYGTEFMFRGDGEGKVDGHFRMDAFEALDTYKQWETDEVWSYLRNLLHWRRNSKAITRGKMKHFIPKNGVYVYFREYEHEKIMVVSNHTSKPVKVDLSHYVEETNGYQCGLEVLSGAKYELDVGKLDIKGNYILILKLC